MSCSTCVERRLGHGGVTIPLVDPVVIAVVMCRRRPSYVRRMGEMVGRFENARSEEHFLGAFDKAMAKWPDREDRSVETSFGSTMVSTVCSSGTGDPLVLLQGGGSTVAVWDRFAEGGTASGIQDARPTDGRSDRLRAARNAAPDTADEGPVERQPNALDDHARRSESAGSVDTGVEDGSRRLAPGRVAHAPRCKPRDAGG